MTAHLVDPELERVRREAEARRRDDRAEAFTEAAMLCDREEKDAKDAAHARGAARCAYRLRQKANQERLGR